MFVHTVFPTRCSLVIFLNTILIGVETEILTVQEEPNNVVLILQYVTGGWFALELGIRVFALGWRKFFVGPDRSGCAAMALWRLGRPFNEFCPQAAAKKSMSPEAELRFGSLTLTNFFCLRIMVVASHRRLLGLFYASVQFHLQRAFALASCACSCIASVPYGSPFSGDLVEFAGVGVCVHTSCESHPESVSRHGV